MKITLLFLSVILTNLSFCKSGLIIEANGKNYIQGDTIFLTGEISKETSFTFNILNSKSKNDSLVCVRLPFDNEYLTWTDSLYWAEAFSSLNTLCSEYKYRNGHIISDLFNPIIFSENEIGTLNVFITPNSFGERMYKYYLAYTLIVKNTIGLLIQDSILIYFSDKIGKCLLKKEHYNAMKKSMLKGKMRN